MVAVAYLMWANGWGRDAALDYVRVKRPGVRPHPVFMALLAEWERELRAGYRMLEEIAEVHVRPTVAAYLAAVLAQEGRSADAEEFAHFAASHAWEDDIVTQVMWRVARAQVLAPAGEAAEAELLALEAVDLAAPTDFLDLQATAQLALARVLREAGSPAAADAAARAQAVYELKGNVVGVGWAAQLVETAPGSE